jgi:hypothetical protein
MHTSQRQIWLTSAFCMCDRLSFPASEQRPGKQLTSQANSLPQELHRLQVLLPDVVYLCQQEESLCLLHQALLYLLYCPCLHITPHGCQRHGPAHNFGKIKDERDDTTHNMEAAFMTGIQMPFMEPWGRKRESLEARDSNQIKSLQCAASIRHQPMQPMEVRGVDSLTASPFPSKPFWVKQA